MRVLVVAATGFVGGHVARAFLARGDSVVALVRSRELAAGDRRLAGARLALGTLGALPEEATAGPFDAVVYAAGVWRRDVELDDAEAWRRCQEVYVRGVETLAERALDWKAHFVFLSGVSRYGDARWSNPMREDAAPGRLSVYGAHKRKGEAILARLGDRGLRWTALAPPEVYGSHDRGGYVRFLYERVRARRLVLVGAGDNRWSLCNVGNLAAATLQVVGGEGAGVLHIADARSPSQREVAAALANALGRHDWFPRVPRRWLLAAARVNAALPRPVGAPPPFSPAHVRVRSATLLLDTSRASALGFVPRETLEHGVAEAVAWWQERAAVPSTQRG